MDMLVQERVSYVLDNRIGVTVTETSIPYKNIEEVRLFLRLPFFTCKAGFT